MKNRTLQPSLLRQRKTTRTPRRALTVRPAAAFNAQAIIRRIASVCEGRSLSELGAVTGFSHETARRVLNGVTAPSARFIIELCTAFDVSADWLLMGKGSAPKRLRCSDRTTESPRSAAHGPRRRRLPREV